MSLEPIILGIDPSSVKLAFYALNPLTPTVMAQKFTLGKKYGPEVAAMAMDESLHMLERIAKMSPASQKFAFIESPIIGRGGPRATMVQAFTSGVVQSCLVKSGYTVYLTNPSTWKTWLTGKANGGKPEIARAAKQRFPKDWQACNGDGDLIDAAMLARFGHQTVRRGTLVASIRGL